MEVVPFEEELSLSVLFHHPVAVMIFLYKATVNRGFFIFSIFICNPLAWLIQKS